MYVHEHVSTVCPISLPSIPLENREIRRKLRHLQTIGTQASTVHEPTHIWKWKKPNTIKCYTCTGTRTHVHMSMYGAVFNATSRPDFFQYFLHIP